MGGQMMRRDALEQRWHGSSLRRAVNPVVPELRACWARTAVERRSARDSDSGARVGVGGLPMQYES